MPTAEMNMEERLRAEAWRLRDDLELAYEVLAAELGLSLDGVRALMDLHRRGRGIQGSSFTGEDVLAQLGHRWWPTGVIARALLANGGKGISARQRSDHHHRVSGLRKLLREHGQVESRRVGDDGQLMTVDEEGRGRVEWRRA
jgi:hypothetical protein